MQKMSKAFNCCVVALVVLLVHVDPVEAKKFSIKRFAYNVVTFPLYCADETIRLSCVAYCYSRVHGPRDPWGTIGGLVAKEKIILPAQH